jgi:hypothetical protein
MMYQAFGIWISHLEQTIDTSIILQHVVEVVDLGIPKLYK